jgi:RHS repeat-associated protein
MSRGRANVVTLAFRSILGLWILVVLSLLGVSEVSAATCKSYIPDPKFSPPVFTESEDWTLFHTFSDGSSTTEHSHYQFFPIIENPTNWVAWSGLNVTTIFQECDGVFPTASSTSPSTQPMPPDYNSCQVSVQASNGMLTMRFTCTSSQPPDGTWLGGTATSYSQQFHMDTVYSISKGDYSITTSGGQSVAWIQDDQRRSTSGFSVFLGSTSGNWPVIGPRPPESKDPNNNPTNKKAEVGSEAVGGQCPLPNTTTGDPVDMATGQYFTKVELMAVAAGGAPLRMDLQYSSANPVAGSAGFGWGHPYMIRLEDLGSFVKVTWPDRHVSIYNFDGVDGYNLTAADAADTLKKHPDGSYLLTDRRQKSYAFDSSGRLISTTDRLGFVRKFSYLLNGVLDKVTDDLSGRFMQFGHDTQNRVISVTSAGAGTASLAYSAAGDLVAVTDGLGNVTRFSYDTQHRLITKVDPFGATRLVNTYDSAGRIASQDDGISSTQLELFTYDIDANTGNPYTTYQDRRGGQSRQYYDAKFNPIGTGDPMGGFENDGYDQVSGVRTSHYDPLNNQTSFTYDSAGYILTRRDPLGHVAAYTYDAEHNITSSTDEAGNVTRMTYGPNRQLLTVTDAKGGVTSYTYNALGLIAAKTAPMGGVTSYTYDAQGNLVNQLDAVGSTISFSYDVAGRLLSRTDGSGNTWTWTYDLKGKVLSAADPLGNTTRYNYDALDRLTTKTSPKGGVTRLEYDLHNNVISLTDPLGGITTFGYDSNDQLISTTNALGHVTNLTRDAKGRIIARTDPLGSTDRFSYNLVDSVTGISDALNNQTKFSYDVLQRLTTVVDPFNASSTRTYNAVGQLVGRSNAKGANSSYGYDALGQLVTATDAMGGIAVQSFDLNGNRLSFSDTNGNSTRFAYDLGNRITRITTSDGAFTSFTYNARNLVATATNGRGQIASYVYDQAGRLVSITDPSGTATFSYDANGNILTVADSVGFSSYSYDVADRIISYTDVFGNVIGYSYDLLSNLKTLTYPGNRSVTYGYDAANRMVSVTDWSGRVTSYSYDPRGNLTGIVRPNGTKGTITYDAKGQITLLAETTTGNVGLYHHTLTYDANGNIGSQVSTSETTLPLLPVINMTYGSDNRLSTFGTQTVSYDADGNMTSGPLMGGTATYSYDARSRLNAVSDSTYKYDAQGIRVSAVHAGTGTRYVVDPNAPLSRVLMETDSSGIPTTYYIYGATGLLSRESSNGSYQTYHYDLRGSTMRLVDSTGGVTDSYAYGPYGELVSSIGNTANPFRYNGRYGVMTEPNGLYYMRARYYTPDAKRFVNRDVLLGNLNQSQSLNRFVFVNGNPVKYVDPSGYLPFLERAVLFGLGVGLIATAPAAGALALSLTGTAVGALAIDTALNGLLGELLSAVVGIDAVRADEVPIEDLVRDLNANPKAFDTTIPDVTLTKSKNMCYP